MRLITGFFASLLNFALHKHPSAFNINLTSKWSWFYLRQEQLLLFLQDPTHLVTKWRNRLLSSKAQLCIGQRSITMEHLRHIIDSEQYTKLDHNLTKTDLNPKDRRNYHSCIKLISDDVLNILNNNNGCSKKNGHFPYRENRRDFCDFLKNWRKIVIYHIYATDRRYIRFYRDYVRKADFQKSSINHDNYSITVLL